MKSIMEDRPVRKISVVRILAAVAFCCLLTYGAVFVPLPYVFTSPGRPIPASSVVQVEGGSGHAGVIYITTVITERANVALVLYHFLEPLSVLSPIPRADGNSAPDPYQVQLDESLYRSKVFALREMGYKVPVEFEGAQVTGFVQGSGAEGILQPGDVITAVDGVKVTHQRDIHSYLSGGGPAAGEVQVSFQRGGGTKTAQVPLLKIEGKRASLGLFFQARMKRRPLPVGIRIRDRNFSGSSAGLPIALEIIHQMKKEDITAGARVAASGTLGENGRVRPVVGVAFKVRGAEREGCRVFLCAPENYREAKEAAVKIKVLPAADLHQALMQMKSDSPVVSSVVGGR
jgi:PDZ domain-containing protein